uniref:Reverse transcriptase Ty1/copia-type domain-containing protein n=1 Tax=Strongyloides venezuelensis TaxID=75913 RepID=A0A0K0EYZ9_STRVS
MVKARRKLWHERLGHCCKEVFTKTIGINYGYEGSCNVCSVSKIKRNNHKLINEGSMKNVGIRKERFWLIAVDSASKLTAVVSLKCKSEAPVAFDKIVKPWEVKTKLKVQRVRCDNAPELKSESMRKILIKRDVILENSAAYNPQQNPCERHNGIIKKFFGLKVDYDKIKSIGSMIIYKSGRTKDDKRLVKTHDLIIHENQDYIDAQNFIKKYAKNEEISDDELVDNKVDRSKEDANSTNQEIVKSSSSTNPKNPKPTIDDYTIAGNLRSKSKEKTMLFYNEMAEHFICLNLNANDAWNIPEWKESITIPEGCCMKLNKVLYELKQAGITFYLTISKYLKSLDFYPTEFDNCLYVKYSDGEKKVKTIILVYVDDCVIASRDKNDIYDIIKNLESRFSIKNLGELGVNSKIFPSKTPMKEDLLDSEDSEFLNEKLHSDYRTITGKLLHISGMTRVNIAYAVQSCSKFTHKPLSEENVDIEIVLSKEEITKENRLQGFSDSSFGEPRPCYGNIIYLFSVPIFWKSKQINYVTTSPYESELVGLFELVKNITWIYKLFNQLSMSPVVVVYTDNLPIMKGLEKDNYSKTKAKHIRISSLWLKEGIDELDIKFLYIPSENM